MFFKLKMFANAFSHSVTYFHFGKQDRVRKYRLGIFLFKVELGTVEINVLQTYYSSNVISIPAKFFITKLFSFISVKGLLICLFRNVTEQNPTGVVVSWVTFIL